MENEDGPLPYYVNAMLAGAVGGTFGDILMHSLDTVKTRQQAAPNVTKYVQLGSAYRSILREEGLVRGLYSGITPAIMGSLPGSMLFFGFYEFSKHQLLDMKTPETLAHLTAGFLGDLLVSTIYVPSEVLKTRLQLQGRHNNPSFNSGYNYRSTWDAIKTIVRHEGPGALYYGYRATLMRDLPFSAMQFAFYGEAQSTQPANPTEKFQKWAHMSSKSREIGVQKEILTGALAGGLAGFFTTPLDVVKTRIQTQVRKTPPSRVANYATPVALNTRRHTSCRAISTSSPSTTLPPPEALKLNTSSILVGLKLLYSREGTRGCFRGVGPRLVWTSTQSSLMLLMYRTILNRLEELQSMGVVAL